MADEKKAEEDKQKRIADEKKAVEEKRLAANREKGIVETSTVTQTPDIKSTGPIVVKQTTAKQIEADKKRASLAKSIAEDQAIIDAAQDKKYAEMEKRRAEEAEIAKEERKRYDAEMAERRARGEKSDADYSTPLPLDVDKYRPTMEKANEYVKMKRYEEAKKLYEEALKLRPNDLTAKNKLAELEKLIKK